MQVYGKVFHPFPNRKIEPRSSYIVGGVIVTTKIKELESKIQQVEQKISKMLDELSGILKADGYPDVQVLMTTFRKWRVLWSSTTMTLPNGNSRSRKKASSQKRPKKKVSETGSGSCRHRADRNASQERSLKTETDNFGITTPPTQAAVIT